MFVRDCYKELLDDILESLPRKSCKTLAILGTAGIGKSSLFLFVLKVLFETPASFGLVSSSFYHQTRQDLIWLYEHVEGDSFSCRFVPVGEQLEPALPLFADLHSAGSPTEHAGISLIFTSFNISRYKELTKNGWCKVMPTWSAEEQTEYFNSPAFEIDHSKEIAERAYSNISFFGGSIRKNIVTAQNGDHAEGEIEEAMISKGGEICDRFFKAGFGGTEDVVSDILVHRNPQKVEEKYKFGAKPYVYSFASPFVLRCFLSLNENILANQARNKYNAGTFRGGDNGNEFELLCLHGFKISGVEFDAQPLTDEGGDAQVTKVKFPPKRVLPLNWRDQMNYLLEADVLYIPPYGNLESGDAFCLIKIKERWTLVILQCTIAEQHPVKQNGIKIIRDCYKKNQALRVEDIVIMFMIPVNGRLKTAQSLTVNKANKDGEFTEVQRPTITVTAQYKIENALSTVDTAW